MSLLFSFADRTKGIRGKNIQKKNSIMSRFITILLLFLATVSTAQPRVVDRAIVKMQTEMTFPENFGRGGGGGPMGGDGERVMVMGGPGGMESSTTVYYKGDMTKMASTSDFGNNIVITDRKSGRTTTLIEAMGRKTGFYSTPEDEAAMRSRGDSMREARRDSLQKMGIPIAAPRKPEVEYTNETKKIAGYTCKKALIKTGGGGGGQGGGQRSQASVTEVWYTPDFKLAGGFNVPGLGGGPGRGMMGGGMSGLEQIEGFPMEVSMERGNGMKMHMVVSKIQLDADIPDKEFEIPKGYDVKPMSEMMNRGGGGRTMIMRVEN